MNQRAGTVKWEENKNYFHRIYVGTCVVAIVLSKWWNVTTCTTHTHSHRLQRVPFVAIPWSCTHKFMEWCESGRWRWRQRLMWNVAKSIKLVRDEEQSHVENKYNLKWQAQQNGCQRARGREKSVFFVCCGTFDGRQMAISREVREWKLRTNESDEVFSRYLFRYEIIWENQKTFGSF